MDGFAPRPSVCGDSNQVTIPGAVRLTQGSRQARKQVLRCQRGSEERPQFRGFTVFGTFALSEIGALHAVVSPLDDAKIAVIISHFGKLST